MTHPHAMPEPSSPHDPGCTAHPASTYAYIGSELDCTCGAWTPSRPVVLGGSLDRSPIGNARTARGAVMVARRHGRRTLPGERLTADLTTPVDRDAPTYWQVAAVRGGA